MPKKTTFSAEPDPLPPGRVVPFPKPCQPAQRYRLTDGMIITFPFSRAECEMIQQHLKDRSPEICLDIVDPAMRDVIERWIAYNWLPHQTAAQAKAAATARKNTG